METAGRYPLPFQCPTRSKNKHKEYYHLMQNHNYEESLTGHSSNELSAKAKEHKAVIKA